MKYLLTVRRTSVRGNHGKQEHSIRNTRNTVLRSAVLRPGPQAHAEVEGSLLLSSRAVASLLLFTKLDKPNGVIIDPFSVEEEPLLPIKPVFQLGDEIVTDLSIIGGWWYKIEGGQEIAVNVSEHLEFESYDKSTYTLTVRRDFIRDTVLRFKSALFPDKQIPSSPPENCNRNDIRLIRKY